MNRLMHRQLKMNRRANRVRSSILGTTLRPRLSVHVSNQHVTAQILDDRSGTSLAYATTVGQKDTGVTMTEKAEWVGKEIAKKAMKRKLAKVVFDRGSRKYHGRVRALAEAARKGGLEF